MNKDTLDQLKKQLYESSETLRKMGVPITEETLDRFLDSQLMLIPNVSDEEKLHLKLYLESHLYVQHDHEGYAILSDEDTEDREWYTNSEHEDEHFWKLYKQYLLKEGSMDFTSLNKLDEVTLPRIMNCLGNPMDNLQEQRVRYGMVIGDVQSGKTSTYGGLICKAADSGMKVVILLAGQTESLRQQTQERMEEDIVGYTIRLDDNRNTNAQRVGVGLQKGYKPIVTAYTSYEDDFKVGRDRTMASLEAQSSLVMFIVKKNVPVLKRLYSWLTNENQTLNENGKLPLSLLLIDDEADNASVNTKKPEYDPTATNAIIRKLCEAFTNSNYVGFTATPFANIFINPIKDEKMETTDLFPKDFIYVLPTPSAYIGAMRIFAEPDEKNPNYGNCGFMLKFITDITEPSREELMTMTDERKFLGPLFYKHKADWRGELPKSLDDALKCFYLANAIRDLDGDKAAPRTMLVNVSRFQKVESYIKQELAKSVEKDYNEINCNFSGKKSKDKNLKIYQQLSNLFDVHYSSCGYDIDTVLSKSTILAAIEKIRVIVVNGTKEAKEDAPDYKTNPSQRIIAVGGLALSRGLTLKGLMTSYFYRNTATYDTLMQMGRWFGYRPKYDRLCQIWITNTSANWYREIALSTEELKNELGRMTSQHLTPKEFGLRVRRDDTALEITARNKMRSSTPINEIVSFWGDIFETPYFSHDSKENHENVAITKSLLKSIVEEDNAFTKPGRSASLIARGVEASKIINFLSGFNVSVFNRRFPVAQIIENVQKSLEVSNELAEWDVAIMGGSGESYSIIPGIQLNKAMRTLNEWNGSVFAFSHRGVVGGNNDGKLGLEDPDNVLKEYYLKEAEKSSKSITSASINRQAWFKYANRKPILFLYPIFPKKPQEAEPVLKKYIEESNGEPIMGIAIGFPGYGHPESEEHQFFINVVYKNNIEEDDDIDDEDLD